MKETISTRWYVTYTVVVLVLLVLVGHLTNGMYRDDPNPYDEPEQCQAAMCP